MQFEPSTAVYDACRVIRERVPEAQTGQGRSWVIYWLLKMCLHVFHFLAKERLQVVHKPISAYVSNEMSS